MADLIDRQAAIDAIRASTSKYTGFMEMEMYTDDDAVEAIEALPSAQPEYCLDEWCTECKEYDHERHCCPRFNHVIRTTLQEVQAEQPGIVRCRECRHAFINEYHEDKPLICGLTKMCGTTDPDWFCADGERRTDE